MFNLITVKNSFAQRVIKNSGPFCIFNNFCSSRLKNNYIPIAKKRSKKNRTVFACDFETFLIEQKHWVSCFSIVSHSIGLEVVHSVGFKSVKESDELFLLFLEVLERQSLINPKSIFVFHNLGRFDGLFILEFCTRKNIPLDVITRNNIIYKIVIKFTSKVEICDSFLVFPASLNDFCNAMNVKNKLNFNIVDVNYSNPDDLILLKEYCLNDSIILYKSYIKYLNLVWDKFNVEITESLTLSSLAMKIYRTNFYSGEIFKSFSNVDHFVRESYTGGAVDVFKPFMENGFHYDINSLYPFLMKNRDMPVGEPFWIDHLKNLNDFFGFVEVTVESPHFLYKPFLPVKDKHRGLIFPLGKWKAVYFSEEIKEAVNFYGYKIIEIHKALGYKRGRPFDNFVDELYKIRVENTGGPLSLIAKRLMNSLYGRFGMRTDKSETIITNNPKKIREIYLTQNILDSSVLEGTNYLIITHKGISKDKITSLYKEKKINSTEFSQLYDKLKWPGYSNNVAVQISSAITSYGRIEIYKYKKSEGVIYSDTDSIFTTKKLPDNLIGKELGKMKLENIVKKAYFISPKLYMIITDKNTIKSKGVKEGVLNMKNILDIYHTQASLVVKYENFFQRNFKSLEVYKKNVSKIISGVLHKRKKIFKQGFWVDTAPIVLGFNDKNEDIKQ